MKDSMHSIRLNLTQLESRDTPDVDPAAPFGSGVAFTVTNGNLLGHTGEVDTVYLAAGTGNGPRVLVVGGGSPGAGFHTAEADDGTQVNVQNGLGDVLLNVFVGDPSVLTGCTGTVLTAADGGADTLVLAGGTGDGDLLYYYRWNGSTLALQNTILVGSPADRFGLILDTGNAAWIPGQKTNIDLFVTKGVGAGPVLYSFDAAGNQLGAILVGPETDRSGGYHLQTYTGAMYQGAWVVGIVAPDLSVTLYGPVDGINYRTFATIR